MNINRNIKYYRVSYIRNNWKITLKRFKDKDEAVAFAKKKLEKYRKKNRKGNLVVSGLSLRHGKPMNEIFDVFECERTCKWE